MGLRWKSYFLLGTTLTTLVVGLGWTELSCQDVQSQVSQSPSLTTNFKCKEGFLIRFFPNWQGILSVPVAILLLGIGSQLLLWLLLDRLLFSRLKQLRLELEALGRCDALNVRLSLTGTDEVARISNTLNCLLDVLEERESDLNLSPQSFPTQVDDYQDILEAHPDLIFRFLPDGTLTFVNPAFCQFVGQPAARLLGQNFLRFLPNPDQDYTLSRFKSLTPSHPTTTYEHQLHTVDQAVRWVQHTDRIMVDEHGHLTGFQAVARDITAYKQAQAQLERQVFFDALTDLPNRARFIQRIEQSLRQSQQQPNQRFSVILLDLDQFKDINDSLSRLTGDQLLVAIADKLQKILPPSGLLSRLGGDEFAILMDTRANETSHLDSTQQLAAQILATLKQPFSVNGHTIFATASLGIVLGHPEYSYADQVLQDADIALSAAKAQGSGQYQIFSVDMRVKAAQRLQLATDLRHAIDRQEFCLHYQPIVSLRTGIVEGFEVLVRWQHPEHGLIFPGDFIPVAEETGLIVPIDWWVMGEACRQVQSWMSRLTLTTPIVVNVNISSKQFLQPSLVPQIQEVLKTSGLQATQLKIEITESVVMEDIKLAATRLNELKKLGVKLSIDDFGTGYSSLNYLHSFPIDNLKIDRSFVNQLEASHESLQIVQAIIALAHNLGFTVVAEGIESESQLIQLSQLGCEYGQGYFFSKPVIPEAAEALIGKQWSVGLLQPF